MEKIIYSKYSNDRSNAFAIRTDICMDAEGKKQVYKSALFSEGEAHLKNMYQSYIGLCGKLQDEKFSLAECSLTEDTRLKFQYLEGKTLDAILDEFLKNDAMEELEKVLLEYINAIYEYSNDCEFVLTKEFEEVFGNVQLNTGLKSSCLTNVDMILSNVFVLGNQYKLIDYEWVFDFPIPAHYIAFRVLYYYINSSIKRQILNIRDLYGKAGISTEEIAQYKEMEKAFQNYILSGRVKYNDFYGMISPGVEAVLDKEEGIHENNLSKPDRMLHIFFSEDEDISEKNSVYYRLEDEETANVKADLGTNIKTVRLDPGEHSCVVEVKSIDFNGQTILLETMTGNWTWKRGQKLFFATQDPQMVFQVAGGGVLQVHLKIMPIEDTVAEVLGKQFEIQNRKIDKLSRQLEEKKRRIHAMENTKTWKLHEKCSEIFLKKGK